MPPLHDTVDLWESLGSRKRKRATSLPEIETCTKRRLLSPPPQLSRDQVESIEAEFHDPLQRAQLTEKNLKLHTRAMPRSRKIPSQQSYTTISTSNEQAFGIQLQKNGVAWAYQDTRQAADDTVAIQTYLANARQSPPPDEEQYARWLYEVSQEDNEASSKFNMWTEMAKKFSGYDFEGYRITGETEWVDADSDITYKLSNPKPDLMESFSIDVYPERVVEELSESIQLSSHSRLAMPTLCVEWKAPMINLSLAIKQAAYDGAVMAQAASTIQQHMGKTSEEHLRKTQAATIAINGVHIKILGHHIDDNDPSYKYKMFSLKAFDISQSLEAFRDAHRAVRNAQDWAREQATRTRDQLRDHDAQRPPEIKWLLDKRKKQWYYKLPDGTKKWADAKGKAPELTPPSTELNRISASNNAGPSSTD